MSVNCTAIIKELDCIIVSKTIIDGIGANYQSESIFNIGFNGDEPTLSIEMEFSYNKNLTHEIILSAILDIDYVINP